VIETDTRRHVSPGTGPLMSSAFPRRRRAWALLVLPVVVLVLLGTALDGWSWTSLPVVLGWFALYPFTWALTNRIVAPRPERFNTALQVWAVVAVPLLAASVLVHPWLLWVGSVYGMLFAVNILVAISHRRA